MADTVVVALISTGGALIVCLINNYFSNKKRKKEEQDKEVAKAAQEAAKEERLAARLNAIEKKQEEVSHKLDIHNGYAEKIGAVQQDIAYIKGKLEKGA